MRQILNLIAAACVLVVTAATANAQMSRSIGAGVAAPVGDLGDASDNGFTVRGQTGVSLALAAVHIQGGWTHFKAKSVTVASNTVEGEAADVLHIGVGARVALGLVSVGANMAYFVGDGEDGVGIFPEASVGLGPIEVVADYRIDGDAKWLGLRAALKF